MVGGTVAPAMAARSLMRFLVFQHVDIEHPGIFRTFWREAGIAWDAVELDDGQPISELTPYDALVVMGGPMDVSQEDEHPWLGPEKAPIRRFVGELQRPYLGICLAHQLLASALGGDVGLGRTPEVGGRARLGRADARRSRSTQHSVPSVRRLAADTAARLPAFAAAAKRFNDNFLEVIAASRG